ncbi:MAG: N-acetylmuramoyl-L-alanine amidase, partial [Puniceicoccales bacterium]|nr:N-acetylmuramoyl-L-alanine amidase [Puniceicoccales bacterium]
MPTTRATPTTQAMPIMRMTQVTPMTQVMPDANGMRVAVGMSKARVCRKGSGVLGHSVLTVLLLLFPALLFSATGTLSAQGVVNVSETFRKWGFWREAPHASGSIRWKNRWSNIEVTCDKSVITLSGVRVWLGASVSESAGYYYVRRFDFDRTFLPIVAPRHTPATPAKRVRHVLLDPGHGGKDAGGENVKLGMKEKTLTLDVARRLKLALEQRGLRVTLTRTQDVEVPIASRAPLAKRYQADLFVSIHFNSASGATANGIET